jgi:hypothetical protein
MSDLLKDLVTSENCEETSENPLNSVFQNFIDSSRTQKFVEEVKFDSSVQLSSLDKQKIKSRSNVMAKQFFPDKDEEFVQGNHLVLIQTRTNESILGKFKN